MVKNRNLYSDFSAGLSILKLNHILISLTILRIRPGITKAK